MRNLILGICCFAAGLLVFKFFPNILGGETEEFLIIGHIKKVAKLQTVEYTGYEIMNKTIKDWAGAKTTMTFIAVGKVMASIDLDKMEMEQDEPNKLVKIKLPAVEISNPTAEKFAEVCKEKKGLGREPTKAERNKWHSEAFGKIKKAAIKANVKTIAASKAKGYLTTFIEGFGWKVEFI
ncbi:MAG: DUF4230 domain-containing protein [Chitinophagales bacterium]